MVKGGSFEMWGVTLPDEKVQGYHYNRSQCDTSKFINSLINYVAILIITTSIIASDVPCRSAPAGNKCVI
jgi:hypothetical protein